MNDQDYRDVCAMLAMNGLIARRIGGFETTDLTRESYEIADSMLEARRVKEEPQGIVAIKKKRTAK